MRKLLAGLIAISCVLFVTPVLSQAEYPNKPILLVVGFAAGGISAAQIARLAPVVKASGAKVE